MLKKFTKFSELFEHATYMTDKEKLFRLRTDRSFFTKIYDEHKGYALRFLRTMHDDMDVLYDLYQDAMIVLYEKSLDPNFELTSSIQTYINSICRNQLLTRFKHNSRFIAKSDDFDAEITDWFPVEEFDREKEERITAMEKAMEQLKQTGEKCYEILSRFFYGKESMEEIAIAMGYTNGDNVKNQKSRCQKKLKELVHTDYGTI